MDAAKLADGFRKIRNLLWTAHISPVRPEAVVLISS